MEASLLLEPAGDGLADRLQNQRPEFHHRQDHPLLPPLNAAQLDPQVFGRNQTDRRILRPRVADRRRLFLDLAEDVEERGPSLVPTGNWENAL